MAIKPVAMTEEEIQIYKQEESLARLYERRQDEYDQLLERLEMAKPFAANDQAVCNVYRDICEFLLREAQFKKLI